MKTLDVGTPVTVRKPFNSTDDLTGRRMFIAEVTPVDTRVGGEQPQYGLSSRAGGDVEAYVIRTRVAPLAQPEMVFIYRGDVERGTGRGYQWRRGYSETSAAGGIVYPWRTKTECRAEANAAGACARFVEATS